MIIFVKVIKRPFIRDDNGVLNSTKSNDIAPDSDFKMSIDSISQNQVVSLSFSKAIKLSDNFEEDIKKGIVLSLGAENNDELQNWTIISFDENHIEILLDFKDNLEISTQQDPDFLQIEVQNPNLFIAKDSLKRIDNSKLDLLTIEIMPQGGRSIGVGQRVTHSPLFSIPFSANILNFLQAIFHVVNFDLMETQNQLMGIFNLKDVEEYEPYNIRFQFIGYDNSNFLYLIGAPLLFLAINLALVLVYHLISRIQNKWLQKFSQYLKNSLFYSAFLLFFIEMALEISFACIINLKNPKSSNAGEVLSLLIGVIFFVLVCSMIFMIPYFVWKMINDQSLSERYNKRLESVVEILELDNKKAATFFYSSFILRRVFMVFIVFALENYLFLQLQLFILSNLLQITYLINYKPIRDNLQIEIFNEVCTLLTGDIILVYSNWMTYGRVRYQWGYFFNAIYIFNILVNLVIVLVDMIKQVYFKIKQLQRWRKVKKLAQSGLPVMMRNQRYQLLIDKSINESTFVKSKIPHQLTVIQEELEDNENFSARNIDSRRPLNQGNNDFILSVKTNNIRPNFSNSSSLSVFDNKIEANKSLEQLQQSKFHNKLNISQHNQSSNATIPNQENNESIVNHQQPALNAVIVESQNNQLEQITPKRKSESQQALPMIQVQNRHLKFIGNQKPTIEIMEIEQDNSFSSNNASILSNYQILPQHQNLNLSKFSSFNQNLSKKRDSSNSMLTVQIESPLTSQKQSTSVFNLKNSPRVMLQEQRDRRQSTQSLQTMQRDYSLVPFKKKSVPVKSKFSKNKVGFYNQEPEMSQRSKDFQQEDLDDLDAISIHDLQRIRQIKHKAHSENRNDSDSPKISGFSPLLPSQSKQSSSLSMITSIANLNYKPQQKLSSILLDQYSVSAIVSMMSEVDYSDEQIKDSARHKHKSSINVMNQLLDKDQRIFDLSQTQDNSKLQSFKSRKTVKSQFSKDINTKSFQGKKKKKLVKRKKKKNSNKTIQDYSLDDLNQ
eukprot:403350417